MERKRKIKGLGKEMGNNGGGVEMKEAEGKSGVRKGN